MPICRTRSGGARVRRTDASATILVIQACSSGKSTLPGQSILPVLGSAIVLSRSSRESLSSGSELVHAGNLRTVSDIPALVAFHYRRKLVSHALLCLHDLGGLRALLSVSLTSRLLGTSS